MRNTFGSGYNKANVPVVSLNSTERAAAQHTAIYSIRHGEVNEIRFDKTATKQIAYSFRNGEVNEIHFDKTGSLKTQGSVARNRESPAGKTTINNKVWHYDKFTNQMAKSHAPKKPKTQIYLLTRKVKTPNVMTSIITQSSPRKAPPPSPLKQALPPTLLKQAPPRPIPKQAPPPSHPKQAIEPAPERVKPTKQAFTRTEAIFDIPEKYNPNIIYMIDGDSEEFIYII